MFSIVNLAKWLNSYFVKKHNPVRYRSCAVPRLELLEDRCVPANFTWTDMQQTGLWSDPQNWNIGPNQQAITAPGPNDVVIFDNVINRSSTASNAVVTVGGQNHQFLGTVAGIQINGYTGTISLGQNLTVTAAFNQNSGTIAGNYSITLAANAGGSWTGGTLRGNGNPSTSTFVVSQNVTFTIGGNVTLDGRIIQNSGTINWNDSTMTASNGGTFNNLANGSLVVNSGVSRLIGDGAFFNSGHVKAEAGRGLSFSVPVTSYAGTFEAAATVDPDGNDIIGSIAFNNSATIFGGAPAVFPGPQTYNFTGEGIIAANGPTSIIGDTWSNAASLSFSGGAYITSAMLNIRGGVVNFDGNLTVSGGNVNQLAGATWKDLESTFGLIHPHRSTEPVRALQPKCSRSCSSEAISF